jgi:hypothetical protein
LLATTRSRTAAFTSSNGRVRAGAYWTMRPEHHLVGPELHASVLRLRSTASGENSAARNFGLASGPAARPPACA